MVYGHIGWLLEDEFGTGLQCRSYYLMQQLQSRYGPRHLLPSTTTMTAAT